ncbi:Serine dehydrogenase proteinase [uncultured Flavonifractor sp.]|nr:Serine dehydrogenase proteinase [uncultured Flavonifractor sp.]
MIVSPINDSNRKAMENALSNLERILNADVFVYYGELIDGVEANVKQIIEQICSDGQKHEELYVLLTTTGGSLNPVKRIVNIFRNFYKEVNFIIPDYAYSAGTVMCCSGDKIYMDYYSVLGPIDPQVRNKDGKFVAALGYLDKINELIEKAKRNELTNAEFIILKDFDLAELRAYEQARDLAVDLLVEWLPKYKFKNWNIHSSSQTPVTDEDKRNRAIEIAQNLSDNKEWKSHGRPISRVELGRLKLQIDKLEDDQEAYKAVTAYHELMTDYVQKYSMQRFIHTRRFL